MPRTMASPMVPQPRTANVWFPSSMPAITTRSRSVVNYPPFEMSPTRRTLGDSHRLVIKLGTHVVTQDGVNLATARLDALIESMARIRAAGREVVLVSSGAVGMGMRVLGLK